MHEYLIGRKNVKMRLRETTFRVAAVIIGILVAIALAEVALRLVGFEFKFYPSKVQFGWPDPVTIKRLYQPDRDLLWVPKNYAQRVGFPVGTRPSLVFMGCSCTQFGRYDRFLGEIIDTQYPGSTFTFMNLGVGGWSSYQGLQQLKRDVVPLRPRVITIYYGWNDHWCAFGLEDKQIGTFNREHPEVLARLTALSRVVQLIDRCFFSRTSKGKTASQRVSLVDFHANLKEIIHIARENSIIPVLLTAPSGHHLGEEPGYLAERMLKDLSDLTPLHESYVQAVRDVALEDDVCLVDLYRLFRSLSREQLADSFKRDGIHLTEQGNRRIAHYLYECFVQTDLIKEVQGISRKQATTE